MDKILNAVAIVMSLSAAWILFFCGKLDQAVFWMANAAVLLCLWNINKYTKSI